ncbi:hypothetical protein BUALT_Bualt02G0213100 [Buddleja alternifolia]|uniref:DUF4378 domain-containing protein n=1 Tax=Buddleja alternifolia TaxID=168488 RepID=A0AAV6Y229_9LAMI|nr:hypothetical protein BUALT_Bualt02G0213100 [Buddleja alternifolia]
MTTGMVNEQNLEKQIEKQMGCMAGFLQIFDRNQILTGKRLYSAKRLPPSHVIDTSESEASAPPSPAISRELGKPKQAYTVTAPSPEWSNHSPATELRSPLPSELPPKSPLPLPVFGLKEGNKSSWKFSKEAPRLSLDSRATTDAKGGLHPKEIRTGSLAAVNRCDSIVSDATDESQHNRSPSVIARLMGLEPLPNEPEKKPELRRSASESRVSRDLFHSRFTTEGSNFSSKQQPNQSHSAILNNVNNTPLNAHYADPRNYYVNKAEPPKAGFNRGGSFNSSSPWKTQHRRSFFDSGDIFPEPKQSTVSIYGEIGSRLKTRGLDEPSKDLETLRQILEALQLKGLLHSRKPSEKAQVSNRNFVYDESPIVVMKPSRLSTATLNNRRNGNDYSTSNGRNQVRGGVRRSYSTTGEISPSVSPRPDRNVRSPSRTGRSPSPSSTTRSEGNGIARRSNSLVKPKPLSVETQRRVSSVNSPKLSPRRNGTDPTVNNRSPRSKKPTAPIYQKEKITTNVAAEDESSSISGSSITTSTDTERAKSDELKEGRNILERCDKLLHSIAEMTASTDAQPSPVSVLDSSFYRDDSLTPSPVTTKRNIHFKDNSCELEDETWSPVVSPIGSKPDEISSQDSDYVYISDILRASCYLPEDSDVFLLLEKQQYLEGKDTSKVSRLQRKLIFDIINEILDGNKRLPPWKTNHNVTKPFLDSVWSEFLRLRERESSDDLFESICGVLKKDLAGDAINGWGDCHVEMSEAILDIERMIFKDLISEAIRDLAELASRSTFSSMIPKRKLVF